MDNEEHKARQDEIFEERREIYGSPDLIYRTTSKALTALIEAHYDIVLPHDLPGHVIAEMDVIKKAFRNVIVKDLVEDNYDDQINYVRLAREMDIREPRQK